MRAPVKRRQDPVLNPAEKPDIGAYPQPTCGGLRPHAPAAPVAPGDHQRKLRATSRRKARICGEGQFGALVGVEIGGPEEIPRGNPGRTPGTDRVEPVVLQSLGAHDDGRPGGREARPRPRGIGDDQDRPTQAPGHGPSAVRRPNGAPPLRGAHGDHVHRDGKRGGPKRKESHCQERGRAAPARLRRHPEMVRHEAPKGPLI